MGRGQGIQTEIVACRLSRTIDLAVTNCRDHTAASSDRGQIESDETAFAEINGSPTVVRMQIQGSRHRQWCAKESEVIRER